MHFFNVCICVCVRIYISFHIDKKWRGEGKGPYSQAVLNQIIAKSWSGWPADLEFLETWRNQGILCHLKKAREKSGDFVKFRKAREFYRKIGKSQGILLAQNEYRWSFFKIHSCGEQELVMNVHVSRIFMEFLSKDKNEFKLWNSLFFLFVSVKCTVTD